MSEILTLINKKKRGESFSQKEIESWINNLPKLPDYQVASLLAFIYQIGMHSEEIYYLTNAMKKSGEEFCYRGFPHGAKFIDKHSTGGVGDKISIPLAPLVTACAESVFIPMISGRGLGHTGGTLDKLQSIPGFKTEFTTAKFYQLLHKNQACLIGQSKKIVPADQRLYALRDVTGTVESVPLITASILSKKLAENLDALLLDLKCGSGAFLSNPEQSEELAHQMISVANHHGLDLKICMTDMDSPLGHYSGHRLEIDESLEILKGTGPETSQTLTEEFAMIMLQSAGFSLDESRKRVRLSLSSGSAYERFEKITRAQGGDLKKFFSLRKRVKVKTVKIKAKTSGILKWDTKKLGLSIAALGGGRFKKEDKIDPDVGLFHPVRSGEPVKTGQEILKIYYKDKVKLSAAKSLIQEGYVIEEKAASPLPLIRKILST